MWSELPLHFSKALTVYKNVLRQARVFPDCALEEWLARWQRAVPCHTRPTSVGADKRGAQDVGRYCGVILNPDTCAGPEAFLTPSLLHSFDLFIKYSIWGALTKLIYLMRKIPTL